MDKLYFKEAVKRILKLTFFALLAILIGFGVYMFTGKSEPASHIDFGLTFSQKFADEMKIDWKAAFLAMLDDLGVRKVRLIAYWNKIEPEEGEYFFDDLDWQVEEAAKRGSTIILAVGERLPRWPECHTPGWANGLETEQKQEKIKQLITKIVEHYRENTAIIAWQVENEPFLTHFGECPEFDEEFLEAEVALVRQLDFKGRPVILTASGELSLWTPPAKLADVLGTSLYRKVWIKKLGYFQYPIPPVFYYKRAKLVKWLTGVKKIFIIELQAEPWSRRMIYEISPKEREKSMNPDRFRDIIDYTYQTGFDEAYLWGVEWWYQDAQREGGGMWRAAKRLWR